MENKKFEFTEETKTTSRGVTVKRIVALRDFGNIKAGEKGGFVEKEENLSHENDCWVFVNAEVYGNAEVCGNAKVYGDAEVYGNAEVCDNAKVYGDAEATTVVKTFGNAFYYDITVTDKRIKIGCQQHLKPEWVDFTDEEIIGMDGKRALKFWRIFKPLAEQLGLFEEV